MPSVAAIIPARNEAATVAAVVASAASSGLFFEVIVVSDGSTDATAAVARRTGADVLELPRSGGKGAALAAGVARTGAPLLCFLDADLVGLNAGQLTAILAPVLSGEAVMCVGRRDFGAVGNFFADLFPAVGGQRAMRREVFMALPATAGYGIEVMLNRLCEVRRWPVRHVLLPGLGHVRKTRKVGLWHGAVGYLRMFSSVAGAWVRARSLRF